MPFAQVNDLSIYYEVYGNQGSPLLLIMGLGGSHLEWPPATMEKLVTQHQVIVFDNRGVGQTTFVPGTYTLLQLAMDAVGLLDALNIEKAHILGVSMGGMIAQHLVLHYPQRVKGLILGCTTAGTPKNPILVRPTQEVLKMLTKPVVGDRAQVIRKNWHIVYTQTFIETQITYLEARLQQTLTYPSPSMMAYKQQIFAISSSHDTLSRLQRILSPTLIQTGLEDKIIPAQNAIHLAERIPNTHLIEYSNAGHAYLEEVHPQAVTDILAFLQQVDASA